MAAATEYADAKERGDRARMRELDARIFELVGYWDTKGKARFPAKVAAAMHA
jgi:ABC-type sulfate transport system substrate-binding protein